MSTTIYHLLVYSFEKLFACSNFFYFDWCWQDFCDSGFRISVNPLVPVSTKRSHILKQSYLYESHDRMKNETGRFLSCLIHILSTGTGYLDVMG